MEEGEPAKGEEKRDRKKEKKEKKERREKKEKKEKKRKKSEAGNPPLKEVGEDDDPGFTPPDPLLDVTIEPEQQHPYQEGEPEEEDPEEPVRKRATSPVGRFTQLRVILTSSTARQSSGGGVVPEWSAARLQAIDQIAEREKYLHGVKAGQVLLDDNSLIEEELAKWEAAEEGGQQPQEPVDLEAGAEEIATPEFSSEFDPEAKGCWIVSGRSDWLQTEYLPHCSVLDLKKAFKQAFPTSLPLPSLYFNGNEVFDTDYLEELGVFPGDALFGVRKTSLQFRPVHDKYGKPLPLDLCLGVPGSPGSSRPVTPSGEGGGEGEIAENEPLPVYGPVGGADGTKLMQTWRLPAEVAFMESYLRLYYQLINQDKQIMVVSLDLTVDQVCQHIAERENMVVKAVFAILYTEHSLLFRGNMAQLGSTPLRSFDLEVDTVLYPHFLPVELKRDCTDFSIELQDVFSDSPFWQPLEHQTPLALSVFLSSLNSMYIEFVDNMRRSSAHGELQITEFLEGVQRRIRFPPASLAFKHLFSCEKNGLMNFEKQVVAESVYHLAQTVLPRTTISDILFRNSPLVFAAILEDEAKLRGFKKLKESNRGSAESDSFDAAAERAQTEYSPICRSPPRFQNLGFEQQQDVERTNSGPKVPSAVMRSRFEEIGFTEALQDTTFQAAKEGEFMGKVLDCSPTALDVAA